MVKEKRITTQYLIASILMIIFVLSDLLFDFVFSFTGSNYLSFGFTILASIITFIGSNGVIKFEIKHKTDKISLFVRSNFNSPQVIFSILDIICGLISIMSGIIILGGIFKILKILYIPTKFIVVANKGKTIFKAIQKFSLIWVIGRLMTNNFKGGTIMTQWIKNNKLTLTYCIIASPISAFLIYVFLNSYFNLPLWSVILLCIIAVLLTCLLVIHLGGDRVLQAQFRALSLTLDEENANKVKSYANGLLNEQNLKKEIHKLALKQIAEKEKEKAVQEEQISAQQKQALIDAEIKKIQNNQ